MTQSRGRPSAQRTLETLVYALPEAPWAVAGLLAFIERFDCEPPREVVALIATLPPEAFDLPSVRNAAVNVLVRTAAAGEAASDAADLLETVLAGHPLTLVSARRFADAVAALNAHPKLRGLIPAMATGARLGLRRRRQDGRDTPSLGGPSAPIRSLQARDGPDIRGGVALLKVLERAADASAKETVDALVAWPRAPIEPVLNELMRGAQGDPELAASIARNVLVHAHERWAERAYSTLQQFVEAVPSDLQRPQSASLLQLPSPLDGRPAT